MLIKKTLNRENMTTTNGRRIRIVREKVVNVIESANYGQQDTVKAYINLAYKEISRYSLYETALANYSRRMINSLFNSKFK